MSEPLSTEIKAIRKRHAETITITAGTMMDAAALHQRLAELEARHAKALACLKLIAEKGDDGYIDWTGHYRNGSWCAEQARRTLEECNG